MASDRRGHSKSKRCITHLRLLVACCIAAWLLVMLLCLGTWPGAPQFGEAIAAHGTLRDALQQRKLDGSARVVSVGSDGLGPEIRGNATAAMPAFPDVEALMRRVGQALAPYQHKYYDKRRRLCERGFHQYVSSQLPGCPQAGCAERRTLQEAKDLCIQLSDCGGIVQEGQTFSVRASGLVSPSTSGSTAWVRESCHVAKASPHPWHGEVCDGPYAGPLAGFLQGCPRSIGCMDLPSREAAEKLCSSLSDCPGITALSRGRYQPRADATPQTSPSREQSFLRPTCGGGGGGKKAEPAEVWRTFVETMNASLEDPALGLNIDLGPPRDDGSVFVSISAYRDVSCKATLRSAFKHAEKPSLVNVGIVQQNCLSDCLVAEGWADTRKLKPGPPDDDCVAEFCASDLGREHCHAGRVRILRLEEAHSLGPLFARYLNAKLWRGETYFLQIDAHTEFQAGWDVYLASMMLRTASYPRSVISNYPPDGDPRSPRDWQKGEIRGEVRPLCGCSFEQASAGGKDSWTIRLKRSRRAVAPNGRPMYSAFVAAGFFFTHGSFLAAVPPDPFLPYIFMGEEIAITVRLWTSGFDIYAPEQNVLGHEYVRKHGTKFWESVNLIYSQPNMHNRLSAIVLQRVQHLLGFPNAQRAEQVPPETRVRMQEFGLGKVRSLQQFFEVHNLDVVNRKQKPPEWCERGEAPSAAIT